MRLPPKKTPPGRKCDRCGKSEGATTKYGYEHRILHPACAALERKEGKLLPEIKK
jgi:hypothetical protein